MRPGGFVIFDNTDEQLTDAVKRDDVHFYEVPLAKIAKEDLGLELVRNTISLGVLSQLIGMDPAIVRTTSSRASTSAKARRSSTQNIARDRGRRAVRQRPFPAAERLRLVGTPRRRSPHHDGQRRDRATARSSAGCRFMAGYPITPATDILEWMAKHAPKFGGVVMQAEDELAAINMIIGAAFAGTRAMTSTSGPGQALMTEGIGLAGVTGDRRSSSSNARAPVRRPACRRRPSRAISTISSSPDTARSRKSCSRRAPSKNRSISPSRRSTSPRSTSCRCSSSASRRCARARRRCRRSTSAR